MAGTLTDLLSGEPDPGARIRSGRFIQPDGTLTRTAAGSVGIWIADPPGAGTVLAVNGVHALGARKVDGRATFMDYDGTTQMGTPDISTRGRSQAGRRWYLDVHPMVAAPSLGPAR